MNDIELDQFSITAETSQIIEGGLLLSGVKGYINLLMTPVGFLYLGCM